MKVDLRYTELEELEMEWQLFENAEDDWYGVKIKDATYVGAGDPSKLGLLLSKFRGLAEAAASND